MKRTIVLLLLSLTIAGKGIAQFSATLTGYPLVTTGWTTGGSATVIDSTVQLTPASGAQSGYVYYTTPVDLTGCGQFTVDFDFKIVVSPFSMVADGIAFWYISNPPSTFATGGGIGLPANPNGLLMILDTYDNAAPYNVPLETLLGYNGTIPGYVEGAPAGVLGPVVGSQSFITDGSWHHCKIDYNLGNINVYFNYSAIASLTGVYPLAITGYFGFSSSTGAAYSTQSIKDVHILAAGLPTGPTVTSPVYYCQNATPAALTATTTTGSTLHWFTTDTATVIDLPSAPVPNTTVNDTTWYFVRSGSGYCISAPDSIEVIVSPVPAKPVITGTNIYCQGDAFIPFTVTGTTGTVVWNTVPTGGASSTTPISVITTVPGYYSVWVSQKIAGCEGPRDSIGVRVTATPPVPTITGNTSYCQYIGPFVPVTPNLTTTGVAHWYPTPTGGTSAPTQTTVDIAVAGTTTTYLSQVDSGCESNRLPVPITVNPKPAPPGLTPALYCQFDIAAPLTATGTNLIWYGTGVTTGYTTAPTPATNIADTVFYYLTQTTSFGCISDSATFPVHVKPQPQPPVTVDVSYCRTTTALALTATGTNLKWFDVPLGGTALTAAPIPPTTIVSDKSWYVTQTVNGCESNRAPLTVHTIYKPAFTIGEIDKNFVCQFDSITLTYVSGDAVPLNYLWSIPNGASYVNNTTGTLPTIIVRFDSANQLNRVHLTASTLDGLCFTDTFINVKVVELPSAIPLSKEHVCLGDTVGLSLLSRSPTAFDYVWTIDNTVLNASGKINMISTNANHGGPFLISWNDSGMHVIELNTTTEDGCKSGPSYDTVEVHTLPDATFKVSSKSGNLCLEDSVKFEANTTNYAWSYMWSPDHSFDNVNKATTWGKVEEKRSMITLTVTDPFGCKASFTQEIDPSSCCKVFFPNAFTPASTVSNNHFRPVFEGFHRFHIFRVANRWGQTIFESADNAPEWDGTYNGVPQDVGTYYYYVKFDCGGNVIEQKGDITLVR